MNADMLNRGTKDLPPPPLSLSLFIFLFFRGVERQSVTDTCVNYVVVCYVLLYLCGFDWPP